MIRISSLCFKAKRAYPFAPYSTRFNQSQGISTTQSHSSMPNESCHQRAPQSSSEPQGSARFDILRSEGCSLHEAEGMHPGDVPSTSTIEDPRKLVQELTQSDAST